MRWVLVIGAVCLVVSGCAVNYHPGGFLGRSDANKPAPEAAKPAGTAQIKPPAAAQAQ